VPYTFQWSGTDLASATNPENGTVSYTYDGAHHVLTRTDAKGQGTGYSYDAYGRLTAVAHYPTGIANGAYPNQQVNYYYDTNPYGDGISTYTWGRLAAVAFGSACQQPATPAYIYMYGYNPAGRVSGQKMRVTINDPVPGNQSCVLYTPPDQTASYGWDTEGRMSSLTYPGGTNALTYTYDAMGHLTGMTDSISGTTASATYGTAGEIDSLAYRGGDGNWFNQAFGYNSLWQLIGDGTAQYVYAAGQNNGRISQSISGGQTVNYTYDSLNRLATAQATDGSWGNAYSYDGFGNLTAKTVTAGSAPSYSGSYDLATNHGGGAFGSAPYDANGNTLTGPLDPASGNWIGYAYDVENRIVSAGSNGGSGTVYGYDPQGKRVLRQSGLTGGTGPGLYYQLTFYGITGQRLSTFGVTIQHGNYGYCSNGAGVCSGGPGPGYLYFGGRLISEGVGGVLTDRLGSVRGAISYYPWREEKTSTQDGQVKFATYFRDMPGQDYADQRYYTANAGRFHTPDPSGPTNVDLRNPISWNKYVYAYADPVNFNDPHGTLPCWIAGFTDGGAGGNDGGSGCLQDPCDFLINAFGPVPSPICGYSGPPEEVAQPTCEDQEVTYVTNFLMSKGAPKWYVAFAGFLVRDSDTQGVDDRFIVALSGVESTYGKNLTWGPFNAWNDSLHCASLTGPNGEKTHCQVVNPYSNPVQAISGVINNITNGLDYFGARYLSSAQGRFTSADPVFMTAHRVSDPQQWNLYAYSRNNPLRFTDPTGLDIWLQGCGDESDTCHKGYVGSYNDKGKFERTHLSGDLTDSASLGTTGISVDYNGGTYQGVWDTNKNEQSAVTVGGSGALSDLSFTVNGDCNGTCQASGFVNGTNTASGLQALQFAVTSPGSGFLKNPGTYSFDPFHPGRTNFMGYDPNQPQGLPSTHLPVPPSLLIGPNGQPTNVDFHVDARYPFEDVTGFVNHVGSIGHTLFNDVRSIFTGLVDHGNH
jgi:RHS repeat-associated protein